MLLAICKLPRGDGSAVEIDRHRLARGQSGFDSFVIDGDRRLGQRCADTDRRRFLGALHVGFGLVVRDEGDGKRKEWDEGRRWMSLTGNAGAGLWLNQSMAQLFLVTGSWASVTAGFFCSDRFI